MNAPQVPAPGHDLGSLALTDLMLDRLADRRPDDADLRDPLVVLLASLAVDADLTLDDDLTIDTVGATRPLVDAGRVREEAVVDVRGPEVAAVRRPPHLTVLPARPRLAAGGRLRGRLGGAAALTAVLMGGAGVAAAVTGNPLAPLHGIADAVVAVAEQVTGGGTSSPGAQDAAAVSGHVAEAQGLLDAGDVSGAQQLLARAQAGAAGLSQAELAGLATALEALGGDVAAAAERQEPASGNGGRPAVPPGRTEAPASRPATPSGQVDTATTEPTAGSDAASPEPTTAPTSADGGTSSGGHGKAGTKSTGTEPAATSEAPAG